MTLPSRFVRYSFTCPSGHTEIREEMVFDAGKRDAGNEVKKRRVICDCCEADSSSSPFLIRILVNEPMPRPPKK